MLLRKVAIAVISVFFKPLGVDVQAYLASFLLIGCVFVQLKSRPYLSHKLNILEEYSLLVSFMTLYGGLFFMSESMGSMTKASIVVVLLVINVAFLTRAVSALLVSFRLLVLKDKLLASRAGRSVIARLLSGKSFDEVNSTAWQRVARSARKGKMRKVLMEMAASRKDTLVVGLRAGAAPSAGWDLVNKERNATASPQHVVVRRGHECPMDDGELDLGDWVPNPMLTLSRRSGKAAFAPLQVQSPSR